MGTPAPSALYRLRNPAATPFFGLVERHFAAFERAYGLRYQPDFGFWRPVIRETAQAYRECGDLRFGFARAPSGLPSGSPPRGDCGHDFFVAFSCKKRCFCPSCHQKRVLVFSERLSGEILGQVPHRQFVFTVPKRFCLYFRYDRSLLGRLALCAWETIRDVYGAVLGPDAALGMVGSIQTFGELVHWHPHIHAIVSDGGFGPDGAFRPIPPMAVEPFLRIWEHKVFRLLLDEGRIDEKVVTDMRAWTEEDSQHLVRYYGHYSNRSRGKRRRLAEEAGAAAGTAVPALAPEDDADLARLRMQARSKWAALIKKLYEVDPLVCPKCGGEMRLVAFITDAKAIHEEGQPGAVPDDPIPSRSLRALPAHLLARAPAPRPSARATPRRPAPPGRRPERPRLRILKARPGARECASGPRRERTGAGGGDR